MQKKGTELLKETLIQEALGTIINRNGIIEHELERNFVYYIMQSAFLPLSLIRKSKLNHFLNLMIQFNHGRMEGLLANAMVACLYRGLLLYCKLSSGLKDSIPYKRERKNLLLFENGKRPQ